MSTNLNITSTPAQGFDFRKLPPELRNRIWFFALADILTQDRYIEVYGKWARRSLQDHVNGEERKPLKAIFKGTNMSLLSVCPESRSIAKHLFALQLSAKRHKKLLWIEPARDTFFIKDTRAVRALTDTNGLETRSLGDAHY